MGRTHDITISGFDLDRLEAQLKYLIEKIETLEIRDAAVMLHTQSVVDENTKLREALRQSNPPHSHPCQLANLALRNDMRKLCGLLLSVQFVAYQPMEVREIIQGLANTSVTCPAKRG
jgi:hypothetical protein